MKKNDFMTFDLRNLFDGGVGVYEDGGGYLGSVYGVSLEELMAMESDEFRKCLIANNITI